MKTQLKKYTTQLLQGNAFSMAGLRAEINKLKKIESVLFAHILILNLEMS